jgi:hypothetical protein
MMVNANLNSFEREHDVNHQYIQCEYVGCEKPKSNKKYCTRHMYLNACFPNFNGEYDKTDVSVLE